MSFAKYNALRCKRSAQLRIGQQPELICMPLTTGIAHASTRAPAPGGVFTPSELTSQIVEASSQFAAQNRSSATRFLATQSITTDYELTRAATPRGWIHFRAEEQHRGSLSGTVSAVYQSSSQKYFVAHQGSFPGLLLRLASLFIASHVFWLLRNRLY